MGRQLEILAASTDQGIDAAFVRLADTRPGGLVVNPDAFFSARRTHIVALANRHAVPVIYPVREYVEVGGLMAYGSNVSDQARLTGIYACRILKGEKPADLPVMQATRFELVVNLGAAKAIGLTVPPVLLGLADEVVE